MAFKFVNWFFEQKKYESELGKLAKRCVYNDNFPTRAKHFQDVREYFEANGYKQSDIEILLEAWNKFRTLAEVKTIPINQLRSKFYEPNYNN